MHFHTAHPLQAFWNLAVAPIQTQALALALDLGLFEELNKPDTAGGIAARLDLHPANTGVWLDLLWSMGLLERARPESVLPVETRYRASAVASRFFTSDSPENCTQAWQYRARALAGVATQLHELVRAGRAERPPAEAAATSGNWAQAAQVQIGQEQRAISVPAMLQRLNDVPGLPECGRFLDLGGGPGHVAIALARRLSAWHGAVCELPDTARVAQENIAKANLASRIRVLGADLNSGGAMGGNYDLIWCSSVLHFLDDPQAALREMFQALNPGGRLVIAQAEIRDDAREAARVLPFYTPMMLRAKYVPRQGQMPRALADAGFVDIDALGSMDFPMSPVWLYAGRRP
jgi:SAM-dependent methyltransferase